MRDVAEFLKLKQNADFRRLYRRGKVVVDPALVVYYAQNRAGQCRVGVSSSKKIGNAVARNRARRVLTAAFREVCPQVKPGYDFVLVARTATRYKKSTAVARTMRAMFAAEGLLKEAKPR